MNPQIPPALTVPQKTITVDTESFAGGINEIDRNHARTTNYLASAIIGIAFTVFLIHCSVMFYLSRNRADAPEIMSHVFETWITTFVGLAGSAAGFYFGDRRK